MARMAVADGIEHVACTPHIAPGVYNNNAHDIGHRIEVLSRALEAEGIALQLWSGADVHIDPQLVDQLTAGEVPTLGQSHYFLLEPPHQVLPPRLPELVQALLDAHYVPIITHPERLRWIESHYNMIVRLVGLGALIQLTAASVTGHFGRRPKYWSDRMLDSGLVDIVATDAHNVDGRPPILSRARDALIARVGESEALEMVYNRPARVLGDEAMPPRAKEIPPQVGATDVASSKWAKGFFKKLRGK